MRLTCHEPDSLAGEGLSVLLFLPGGARPHVHINCADGEAKFWLEPDIDLVRNQGLSRIRLREIEQIIEEHQDELRAAWKACFGR